MIDIDPHRKGPLVIEGSEVVQEFQGAHERFRGGGVHEIEVDKVFHAQLEQGQHLIHTEMRAGGVWEGGAVCGERER